MSGFLEVKPHQLIKTLIYKSDDEPVAILVRGDHNLNETKLRRYLGCKILEMADDKSIRDVSGGPLGFSGPVSLKKLRII